eukprot:2453635-Lingulodinium_polyedra.AAC.1
MSAAEASGSLKVFAKSRKVAMALLYPSFVAGVTACCGKKHSAGPRELSQEHGATDAFSKVPVLPLTAAT